MGVSGGVDSSLCVALIVKDGFDAIAVNMVMFLSESNSCELARDDIRSVCGSLMVAHYSVDVCDLFKAKVIDYFNESYNSGETPLPCAVCNRHIKIRFLYVVMKMFDADFFATGHYARKTKDGPRHLIKRALCKKRDQSFFLFNVLREHIVHALFPLGEMTKEQTRARAKELGLVSVCSKKSSADICFREVIEKMDSVRSVDRSSEEWSIMDSCGRFLSKAACGSRYTIGQRRGLGVGGVSVPLYVVSIDSFSKTIVVGTERELMRKEVRLERVNWFEDKCETFRAEVKVRSCGNCMGAIIVPMSSYRAKVIFDSCEKGVAAGQACVFFVEDVLVGGGWICS